MGFTSTRGDHSKRHRVLQPFAFLVWRILTEIQLWRFEMLISGDPSALPLPLFSTFLCFGGHFALRNWLPNWWTRDCHNPRKNYDGNVHHLLAVNSDHHRLELWGHGERAPCLWGQRVPDPRLNHLYHHPVPRLGDIIRKPFYFIFSMIFFPWSIQLMMQSTQHFENVFRKSFLNKKDWGMSETFKKHCFDSVRVF